ncbi:MAG TPA: aldehyde dehydrogenase family protein, partial [Candidatus Melainabacteria bacterium]|nr:aldehyde dehydrogenase family protein [Candidatus Melainabacteria bacterium]
MLTDYRPEPFTDFSNPDKQKAFTQALEAVKKKLGKDHPLVVGGERLPVEGDDWLVSANPGNPKQVIGRYAKATQQQAERAMKVACEAFESWKRVPGPERARYLFRAAAIMRRRKHEFSAFMVLEIGKSWAEADADTAEAIDFMEFYGREMIRLSAPQPLTQNPGEENELHYIPLGVGIVIPPWNFPLAILVGMTTASIVAGNSVVLKPSSETPGIAWQFFELMEECGLPPGVFNF